MHSSSSAGTLASAQAPVGLIGLLGRSHLPLHSRTRVLQQRSIGCIHHGDKLVVGMVLQLRR